MTRLFSATTSCSAVARIAVLAALAAPVRAEAGACCAGSTTTIPTRLGECEKVLGGVGLSATDSLGRWDAEYASRASSLHEQSVVTTLAAGFRWNRDAQVGVTAPVWLNHKAAGDDSAWGGGPGDVRINATWDPMEEQGVPAGTFGAPVPVFSLGLRLPTGRSWENAKGALFEDVTGLGPPALTVGLSVERALTKWPWSLGADAEIGIDDRGVHPVLTGFGGVGRTIGTAWTVLGSARYVRMWSDGTPSARTSVGARVVHGRRLHWRGWLGVETDVPAPGLGLSAMQQVSVGAGAAIVR